VVGLVRLARTGPRSDDPAYATRALARRLRRGEVAVIDHLDLDRDSAQALLAARPAAVLNVRPCLSGRYPAAGAAALLAAGVPLVDDLGAAFPTQLHDGLRVRIHDGQVWIGEELAATGHERSAEDVARDAGRTRDGIAARLAALGADMAEYVRQTGATVLDGEGLPQLTTRLAGRTVLVVAPGPTVAEDLAALRRWVRDERPVVLAAADALPALADRRLPVDVVVGGEPVAHEARSLRPEQVPADPALGNATDVALLLAADAGCPLVVLAGGSASLVGLVDGTRTASATALAVRLRLGDRLVDARPAAALHRRPLSTTALVGLLLLAVAVLGAAVLSTPGGQHLLDSLRSYPW